MSARGYALYSVCPQLSFPFLFTDKKWTDEPEYGSVQLHFHDLGNLLERAWYTCTKRSCSTCQNIVLNNIRFDHAHDL